LRQGSRTGRPRAVRAAMAAAAGAVLLRVCAAAAAPPGASAGSASQSDEPPAAAILNPQSQPAGAAGAQAAPNPLSDRFALRAIWFYAQARTQLRLDPSGKPGAGTTLSGEDDLGYGPSDSDGRLELMFRLREKNRLRVDFLDFKRSAAVTPAQPLVYGNLPVQAGDALNTSLTGRILGFTYTRAFIQTGRFEIGAGASVYLVDGDARGVDSTRLASEERSVAGALPAPSLEGVWLISSRFTLTARASYLSASIGAASGTFGDIHTDVQYRWQPNFAVGAGYTYTRLYVEDDSGNSTGAIGVRLTGPELFLRASF